MEKIKRKDAVRTANVDGMKTFSRHFNGINLKRTKQTTHRLCRNASIRGKSEPITTNSDRIPNVTTNSERIPNNSEKESIKSEPVRSNSESKRNGSVPVATDSEMIIHTMTHRRSFTIRREHTTLTNNLVRESTSNYLVRESTSSQLVRESTFDQLIRKTTSNHLVRESTFTKETKTCDNSGSQLRIRQELKSILKCSESVNHDAGENSSARFHDPKKDNVHRCSYRLPVRRELNVQKTVSFRNDFVVRRFKQFDVLYASG